MPHPSNAESAETVDVSPADGSPKSREELQSPVNFPPEWKLTASEVVILRVLFRCDVAEKDDIVKSLYGDSPCESSLNTLKVFVHHLRKKTRRLGMQIHTIYGVGYALTDRDSWVMRLDSEQLSQ